MTPAARPARPAATMPAVRPDWNFDDWRTGRLFFMADPHFGHERIIELCARPFADVREMNEEILHRINSAVSGHDTLVIVGDTVMGVLEHTLPLLRRIKAKRVWLLPGNHDRFSLAYGHRGSAETQRVRRALWRTQYEAEHPGLRAEPDLVPSAWGIRVGGRRVLLSHYPYVGDSREDGDRFRALRPRDTGLPLIHGHVHGSWQHWNRMLNVGVDVWGFRPVREDQVADWLAGLAAREESGAGETGLMR